MHKDILLITERARRHIQAPTVYDVEAWATWCFQFATTTRRVHLKELRELHCQMRTAVVSDQEETDRIVKKFKCPCRRSGSASRRR